MKPRLFLLLVVVLFACTAPVQQPWQKLSNPTAAEVAAKFESPPVEYSISFYWGWDGNVTEEVIVRDLDEYQSKNVQIVSLESGYDMGAPYLSPEWFEKVKTTVRLAKERNMRVYIVDEGKYPSGFAGGKFTTDAPELRMKALVVAERIEAKTGETISRELAPEIVSAAAINEAAGETQVVPIQNGQLNWTAPEGNWQVLLVKHDFRSSPTRAVNNPTRGKDASNSLCDYLDPAATRKFLEFTHEVHKKYVGEEFGKTVLGFRGDEPDYSIRGIPWTTKIFEEFKAQKGYDVQPYVASFFSKNQTEEQQRVRADYYDVWSSLFSENFFKVQADWCAANNVEYLVHLNKEDNMMTLVAHEGDFFKDMRPVQMPGVDAIWNQIWPDDKTTDFPKYASSAAHLFGRPRAFTESFAAYRTRPNVAQAKWVLDHQLVRGLNMVEVMFVPASTRGKSGMTGWLADEKFPETAKYIQRACYLLSQGLPTTELAVYHPTTSLWLGDENAAESVVKIMQQLLEMQRDFDFVDEQSLASLMKLENGKFTNLSGQSYSTVLVPPVTVISKTALNRLEQFKKSGGQVIFLGETPKLVAEKTFKDAAGPANVSWAVQEPSGELTGSALAALPKSDFILDQPCDSIKYTHRRWKDADVYFIHNESTQPQTNKVTFAGKGEVQIWNAMTAKIETVKNAARTENSIEIDLTLTPWETRFVVISGK